MSIEAFTLEAPTKSALDAWLTTPRPAKCGNLFTPAEPMWWPDRSNRSAVNWQAALLCVSSNWQCWLHTAMAYRMAEVSQATMGHVASVLSRAAQAGLNPLNEDHLIDIRERFNRGEFSVLVGLMKFWQECESIEQRPSKTLIEAYIKLPKKKPTRNDVILRLDPEQGPFIQTEQDALYQWAHEQFCQGNLDPEHYIYLRLAMIYGQRGSQLRMMVFDDFVKNESGCSIRIFWSKQKDNDAGWREKFELFNLDKDLYNIIQSYKTIVKTQLEDQYPEEANWEVAIKNTPLFRRKIDHETRDNKGPAPVIIDLPNKRELEDGPQANYHVSGGVIRVWLLRMEGMPGFPISLRTHQPLKISRGHRFRHTLGTDLSNAGLDEWSIASALMHSGTRTVRKYRAVSAELMKLIDEKMSDHLALVVGAFTGTIVTDRYLAKNGERADRLIEDLAVCGSDGSCYLDAPFTCYGCIKFQPLLYANHGAALERLERRRAQTFPNDKTTGVLWDRAILACRKVILDCSVLRASSKVNGDDS
jgi:integrase